MHLSITIGQFLKSFNNNNKYLEVNNGVSISKLNNRIVEIGATYTLFTNSSIEVLS